MVGYKILRGLGRLVADVPHLRLERASLDAIVDAHLRKAYTLLHWLLVLEDGAQRDATRRSAGHELLVDLLRQKRSFAIERLFRILGLRDASADFEQLYDGMHSDDPLTRGTSQELLEQLVPGGWRGALRGLTDELPDAERLSAGRGFYDPAAFDDDALIGTLIAHPDEAIAALAAHLAAQRHLAVLAPPSDAPPLPLATTAPAWAATTPAAALERP
jgi:hypothetical protein